MSSHKTIYLLDAYALIYRSYYAFLRMPRINSKGVNTSAVFGFVNTLVDLIGKKKPDYVVVAFDSHAATFRHEMFPEYKANRDAQPEDIRIAVPYIKRFLEAMNITIVETPGFEADDIIGTLSKKFSPQVETVYMMTPDKDYAQLVGGNVFMYRPQTNGNGGDVWGEAEVCANFNIKQTSQIIDLLGLWGDSSDNIPGCPGVGEKRAKELLAAYETIDGIYENIDNLKGKLKENLANNRDKVLLSRKLATIVTDAPIELDIETTKLVAPNIAELQTIFGELEIRNVLTRISALFEKPQELSFGGLFDQLEAKPNQPEVVEPTCDTAKTVEHEYTVLTTDDELRQLAQELKDKRYFCFDTETTSIDPISAEIVGMSIATEPHKAAYIPFGNDKAEICRQLSIFAEAFSDSEILKIGQNLKYDIIVLQNYGVEVVGKMFDTMIAHFLLFPGRRHNMDDMAEAHLQYRPIAIEELIGKGAKQTSMRSVPLETIKEYAAEDADITLQLYHFLLPKVKEQNLEQLFDSIEMPLMPILADMERNGVKLDIDALSAFAAQLQKQIADTEVKTKEMAGVDFNIASPKQVGEVLFDRLKIDPSARKTKTGQYATNEETLQKLAHNNPIVAEILNYRGLQKLLSTYADALPKLVNPHTGRIHTSYNQTVVITGRLSSTNPNLQNIPIRDDNGREIRKAFVARDAEHILVSADYSQVELRIMAHFSNDEHLIAAFNRGEDIHAATAARIFKVPLDEVTSDMRRKAKTANFGIIYGISAFGLAERLDIPRKEAKEIIDGYFESFPGVKEYMDKCIEDAKNEGAVKTIFGRRRELDDINSRNAVVRGVAERNAINAPIQGTAADIIKIAMINIYAAFAKANVKAKMILQVHDELVFDVPQSELETVERIVVDCMENAHKLSVPLVAEVGRGKNWLEAH